MDRHAATDNYENHQSNRELLEEIAQLEERERVLIGENDDLRGQLVEMKKEEKKKFGDLMVEHRQLKDNANRSQRAENGDSLVPNDIHIKQEHFDDQSNNGQQMYKGDPPTNAQNVTVNIKTEPMDCDFVVVKQEIKEEYDEDTSTNTNQVTVKSESIDENVKVEIKEEIKDEDDHDDDCDGCVRCLVKKEEVSDDGEVDHDEGELIRGGEHEYDEMDQPSSNQPIDSNEVMNQENGLGDEGEDKTDLGGYDEMPNTTNDNHDGSVVVSNEVMSQGTGLVNEDEGEFDNHDRAMVVSNEASSSARARSNRVTSKQSTGSTVHNVNKRKQTRTNRTVKRSKKTVEVGDDESGDDADEDIATDDQVEDKVKVISLNCTEENCEVKSNSLDQLYVHLNTIHGLLPHRCFAQNCNSRFNHSRYLGAHMKHHHSNLTQFVCNVCGKQFVSQMKTYDHWYHFHLTGQFQCNLNQCIKVMDTRHKVNCHQLYKHCLESKRFKCHHEGCSSSFVTKKDLKRHELTHLATRPFHCTWPQCSHSAKQRSNLLTHIRTQHFGLPKSLKEQMEKKIEDNRDPNEYVRVVEEGDE